jgi:hypothetical protein
MIFGAFFFLLHRRAVSRSNARQKQVIPEQNESKSGIYGSIMSRAPFINYVSKGLGSRKWQVFADVHYC